MKKLVFVMLAACTLAACSQKDFASRETVPQSGKTFIASMEGVPTRMYNEDTALYWENGDQIAVYDKSDAVSTYSFAGNDGETSGLLTLESEGSGGAELTETYAVYPFDNASEAADGSLKVRVYADQTPAYLGELDCQYSNVMVAVAQGENLSFKNTGGYLRVKVYGTSALSEVAVFSNGDEVLSGYWNIGFDSDGQPVATADTESSSAYPYVYQSFSSAEIGTDAASATEFWFVLPPATYSSGFTVQVSDIYGQAVVKAVSSPVTIYRNKVTTLPSFEAVFPEVNYLGKGTWTDGNLLPLFGVEDGTFECDVYEPASTPGLYTITGFQLELANALYGQDMTNYGGDESGYWWNSMITVDATDASAVVINQSSYGVYCNGYGEAYIASKQTGTFDSITGTITFPADDVYVGLSESGSWYACNPDGAFKITVPVSIVKPKTRSASEGNTSACQRRSVVRDRRPAPVGR